MKALVNLERVRQLMENAAQWVSLSSNVAHFGGDASPHQKKGAEALREAADILDPPARKGRS